MNVYSSEYYEVLDQRSRRSAQVAVPLVADLVRPRSVVDVGCGTGAWLAVWIEHGVTDVLGVDGDYVDRSMLRIPGDRYVAHDLETPLTLDRSFDLVTSLEVAEHLSAQAAAPFVRSLTRLGPVVLFSAAIPGQGGVHHINEQWPSYWAEIFDAHDYVAIDCFRDRIWDHPDIDWWYAQNLMLYVDRVHATGDERLSRELLKHGGVPPSRVHPFPGRLEDLRRAAAAALARVLPRTARCILVDDYDGLPHDFRWAGPSMSFFEKDGEDWGTPYDDEHALTELERCIERGATHLVLLWSCFWWRDHYLGLFEYLNSRFTKIEGNEALIVFDLTQAADR